MTTDIFEGLDFVLKINAFTIYTTNNKTVILSKFDGSKHAVLFEVTEGEAMQLALSLKTIAICAKESNK